MPCFLNPFSWQDVRQGFSAWKNDKWQKWEQLWKGSSSHCQDWPGSVAKSRWLKCRTCKPLNAFAWTKTKACIFCFIEHCFAALLSRHSAPSHTFSLLKGCQHLAKQSNVAGVEITPLKFYFRRLLWPPEEMLCFAVLSNFTLWTV